MRKRRNSRHKKRKKIQRHSTRIAKPNRLLKNFHSPFFHDPVYHQDYRLWQPDQIPFRDFDPESNNVRLTPAQASQSNTRGQSDIIDQRKIREAKQKICRQRKERRAALFRTKKAGKGKRGPKLRKYTNYSKVRC